MDSNAVKSTETRNGGVRWLIVILLILNLLASCLLSRCVATDTIKKYLDGNSNFAITNASISDEGDLILTTSDGTTLNAGPVRSSEQFDTSVIKDAKINEKGELIFTTTEEKTINIGTVIDKEWMKRVDTILANIPSDTVTVAGAAGRDGRDGVSVTNATLNSNGELIITYSNGIVSNLGVVTGSNGRDGATGVAGAAGAAGKDGKDGVDGKDGADGKDGVGVTSASVNGSGELVIAYSDGTSANLGVVKGADGAAGATGAAGKGISNAKIEDGKLILTFTDGSEDDLGNVKGDKGDQGEGINEKYIKNVEYAGGVLKVTYSDDTTSAHNITTILFMGEANIHPYIFTLLPDMTYSIRASDEFDLYAYQQPNGVIDLPGTVNMDGEVYTISQIAGEGFKNQINIKEINIPKEITRISNNAFEGCDNLKKVAFEDPDNWYGVNSGKLEYREGCKVLGFRFPDDMPGDGSHWTFHQSQFPDCTRHEGIIRNPLEDPVSAANLLLRPTTFMTFYDHGILGPQNHDYVTFTWCNESWYKQEP